MSKRVGNCIYVHKSNFDELIELMKRDLAKQSDIIIAKSEIDNMIAKKEKEDEVLYKLITNYEVIKYDKAKHQISFIDSPDWITANEPEIGDAMLLKMNQDWTWKLIPKRKTNPQIYHGKWRFVDQSFYKDFDVIESYNREQQWQSIPGIKEVKSKIGNKKFWVEFLENNGMEV